MSKFVIQGPSKLSGEIKVFGAKNAAMKMIAACVLISEEVILENVPDILDIQNLINILTKNGAKIERKDHTLIIDTTSLSNADPDPDLVKKLRGSIVLIGPYLARFGKIRLPKPGGDAIGARPIDTHLDAFKAIGAEVSMYKDLYELTLNKNKAGEVILNEASVTATENILMSQVLGDKETIIKNAATEPQIKDLANLLVSAGAKISGAGTKTITICGVPELSGTTYRVMPDPFETSTFVCLSIATKSPLKITNCRPTDMHPFLEKTSELGVKYEVGPDFIEIKSFENLQPTKITTGIHPEFSTDMLPPMGVVLTQANGLSTINETLYENRLGYFKELEKMGAKVEMVNSHEAKVFGPTPLSGTKIKSLDIRAGATLILAGLIANGQTEISNAEIIDRGYERIEERLRKIGAKIERVD